VAQHTRHLGYDAARWADRLVTADPAHLNRVRIADLVREARLFHEPDLVTGEEEADLTSRHVDLFPGRTPATTDVVMKLDTQDAEAFDRAVAHTAGALKTLGDADDLGVRRARAVGILADPQRALDLLDHGIDPGRTRAGAGGAVLWLHLDQTALLDLDTFPAAVRGDGLGTLSSDLLKRWLNDSTVVVKPVLDLSRADAVDQHDPPVWMADLVRLRDPFCVFPGCQRSSRACDLDHIDAYVPMDEGGQPARTQPGNLAPLCRRHHRAKTHTTWHYARRPDGSYRWTTPTRPHLRRTPTTPEPLTPTSAPIFACHDVGTLGVSRHGARQRTATVRSVPGNRRSGGPGTA
jgi:hypothetical protein